MMGRWALASIIVVYLGLGVLYAVETPPWEAPDEPAHYNYIAYLAQEGRFPILQMGDYPHDYLEEIKAAGFPPQMSIDPIRYEFHQPPLYYLLAAPLYLAGEALPLAQQVVILRLFSVVQGGLLLVVAYYVVKEIFPSDFLALVTVAFMATVPMHMAMTAAINNDTLAELVLALVIWLSISTMRRGVGRGEALLLGLLLAAALLTKTTIYAPAIASIAVAGIYRWRKGEGVLRRLGLIFALALLLSFWWFLRNGLVYGGLDLFGWGKHDAIVVGQPTSAEWVAQYGLEVVVRRFLVTSFKSFWAIFGWMGVLVDARIYTLLFLVSLGVALGFCLFLVRLGRGERLEALQRWALGLLGSVLLLILASYLWYNLKFVQHQGRYLFPALIALGLLFALGLREWVRLLSALPGLSPWPATYQGRRARTGASRLFPVKETPIENIVFSIFYLGFVALDLVCLYRFIIPYF